MEAVSERVCLMQQVSECLRRDNRIGVCKCEQIAVAADQQIGTVRRLRGAWVPQQGWIVSMLDGYVAQMAAFITEFGPTR